MAKAKRGFMDYKTYDLETDGYGSSYDWKQSFFKTMGREEAETILKDKSDPWSILGVKRNATFEQIRKAFRTLIMKWHPDRNPGNEAKAEEMSKDIIAAYTILT